MRAFLGLTIKQVPNIPEPGSLAAYTLLDTPAVCINAEICSYLTNLACLSMEDNFHGVPQIVAKNMSAI